MTDTLTLPTVKQPRDLTYDQRIAAEAAFRGLPADPKWPTSARQIYEGLVAAIRVRDAEVDRRAESEALLGCPR